MTNTTVHDQLYDLWRTRPVRLPHQGPAAGVCAGIGYRYSVDPVLVRVAFVVSTIFGGSGIVLYLAAWLTFNRVGDPASAAESLLGRGRSSESHTTMVVLAVAMVIALATIGPVGVGLGGSGAVSLIAMIAGLWLLYQRTPVPPVSALDTPTFAAPPPIGALDAQMWSAYSTLPTEYVPTQGTTGQGTTGQGTRPPGPSLSKDAAPKDRSIDFSKEPTPPSWDPLGVAPFAWDLPEPSATSQLPVPAPKKKSHLTSSVIGSAIIATAVTAGFAVATGSEWFSVSRVAAVGLAVVGIGMIVGALTRKGYGLLIFAAPLAGFVVLTALVDPGDISADDVGARNFAPTTMSQLEPTYTSSVGEIILDLRNLTLTEDRSVAISSGVGNVEVFVPADMDVANDCSGNIGNVECLPPGIDGGADGVGGPVLTLNIDNSVGNVEVHRG